MYIAGLYLSHKQSIESIVCLTSVAQIFIGLRQHAGIIKRADAEGGSVIKSPKSVVGRIITPVHFTAAIVPVFLYLGSVVVNRLEQPAWIQRWRLPYNIGAEEEAWVRTAACVASFGISRMIQIIFNTLGKQWHFIGVRQKPEVVSTGPYAIVRHPLYTCFLSQQVVAALMFWSYIPIISFGIMVAAFAVKMPIEEKIIVESPTIGPAYVKYQQKVTSRVIPYIW